MPQLNTKIHLNMLNNGKEEGRMYGLHWGDPSQEPQLQAVVDQFIAPFISSDHVAVEIGPGGGRWTQYLRGFKTIYAVDYHKELLDELRECCDFDNIVHVLNNGADFPGIPNESVDFVFTFGVFVHLDVEIIAEYLRSMQRILKAGGTAVIHYSDKRKEMAQKNVGFSENTPDVMRGLVQSAGYEILQEDTESLPAASIVRFSKPK